MEEKHTPDNENHELPVHGSGSILAAERKKQNRSVEEIANELNLSISQIRTIELDQTDGLPEPTYVRGYIRSYANLLGLDPVRVLSNYLNSNWQQTTKLDDMPRGIGSAEDYGRKGGAKPGRIIAFLLLCAIGGFLWYSGIIASLVNKTPETESVETTIPSSELSTSTSVEVDANVEGVIEDTEDGVESITALPGAAGDEITDVASEVAELVLEFTQTSWVDIRDKEDNRLAYKSYVAGEELIVSSETSMSVFIGNAEGVTVKYNGEDFDLGQYREGVYAKFIVNEP